MRNIIRISEIKNLNQYKITIFCLLISIFFLPSALPISLIFILISIFLTILKFKHLILKNRFFYIFTVCSGIMIISFLKSKSIDYQNIYSFENNFSFIDLANWLPYFICFIGFQYLLKKQKVRKHVGIFLLLGTVPVVFSCISQYWLKWYGPFSTMNNLVVWFQRSIQEGEGVTGLFNNPNYAAIWLTAVWPFSLIFPKLKTKVNLIYLGFSFLIFYFSILTNSRNSFFCFLIIIPIMFNFRKLVFFKGLFSLSIIIFLIKISDLFFQLNSKLSNLFPLLLIDKLITTNFNSPRLEIFKKAIHLISERPIFGWGAKTFPTLYNNFGGIWEVQHTHNIFLELSHNYGLIVAGIIIISIFYILISSFKIIFYKSNFNNLENKAWFSSFLIFIIFQTTDFTLYDGKICILFWILFAGLSGIIIDYEDQKIQN